MKILVDTTGWKGREVNPHSQHIYIAKTKITNPDWIAFNEANQSYALTDYVTPNSIVEGELVWYVKASRTDIEVIPEPVEDCFVWNGTVEHLERLKSICPHLIFYQAYQVSGVKEDVFVPIICGETCACKGRGECSLVKGATLNTPLRLDETKKVQAITYEQILTLANNTYGHKYQPGYDNIDGNYNYFGTSPDSMRVMTVNADYVGHTFVNIKADGGTRTVFNGHVRSFEELKLINSLVL